MDTETLITLTADVVSAHVSGNAVSSDDLPKLIGLVYTAFTNLGVAEPAKEDVLTPAVSVRLSVKPDHIVCLDCGAKLQMLKRHLSTDHGLTPDEYRRRWNLPAGYPMVASVYAEKRRELAKKIGLGRKPGSRRTAK